MPNLQAAICALIQEQEHAGLQVIGSLTLFYIISTLDTYFRRLHLRQVVNQLGWNWAKLLVGGLVCFVVSFRRIPHLFIAI
jgi:hypothetical protein